MSAGLGIIVGSCMPVFYLEVVHIWSNGVYKGFTVVMDFHESILMFIIYLAVLWIMKTLKIIFLLIYVVVELTSEPLDGVTVWQVLLVHFTVTGLLMLVIFVFFHSSCCNSVSTNTVMMKCTLLILCHFNKKALV